MKQGLALLGLSAAAAAFAGCANLGMDPWPDVPPEQQGDVQLGLDPFPKAMHPHESAFIGLDPFPKPMHPEGQGAVGLNPFPGAMHKGESANLGLDPFPAAMHPEGQPGLGLNPFPAAVHPGQSGGLGLNPFPDLGGRKPEGPAGPGTRVEKSDECPTPPPVDIKPIPKSKAPREKDTGEPEKPPEKKGE